MILKVERYSLHFRSSATHPVQSTEFLRNSVMQLLRDVKKLCIRGYTHLLITQQGETGNCKVYTKLRAKSVFNFSILFICR